MKKPLDTVSLFGFDFLSMSDYDNLLWEMEHGIQLKDGELPILITPNVDQIVKYSKNNNANLKRKMVNAKYVLPDGQPLVWLSKFKSEKLQSRLTGSDLFPLLWNYIRAKNIPTSFILSSRKLIERLDGERKRPTIAYVPCYYSLKNIQETNMVTEAAFTMLQESRPRYLIIGLGYPKQEYLALALLERCREEGIEPPFMFLLGASVEFYTQLKQRAPMFYRKLGIEFVHRFLSEPKRMFKRYFIDDLAFLPLAFKELTKKYTNTVH